MVLAAGLLLSVAAAADFEYRSAGFASRAGVEVNSVLHWAEAGANDTPHFPRAGGLAIAWREQAGVVSATLRNESAAPIKLGRFILAQAEAVPGEVALVMSGWQMPNTVQPTAGKKLVSKTLLQLWDRASATALQFGFVSFDRVNTEIEIERGVVTAYCDFEGFSLPPGGSIESEQLRITRGNDPIAALHAWGDAAAAHYRPRIWPGTPAGWVGWSWVDPFHVEKYEAVVRRNARAIREKLPGSGIEYIWVSRQGQAELTAVAWDEPAGELRLMATRRGNVFLRVPKEFRLARSSGTLDREGWQRCVAHRTCAGERSGAADRVCADVGRLLADERIYWLNGCSRKEGRFPKRPGRVTTLRRLETAAPFRPPQPSIGRCARRHGQLLIDNERRPLTPCHPISFNRIPCSSPQKTFAPISDSEPGGRSSPR